MFNVTEFIDQSVSFYRDKVGGKKVLCAMSGGVDSTVSAVLLHRAIGKNLICVHVDTGLMRLNESAEVSALCRELFDMNFTLINAEGRFLAKLKGVDGPEQKRKIIGEEFIRVFEEEAKKYGDVDYLLQGTIKPDILESGTAGTAMVKSHHNVGGLPEVIRFQELLEPLRDLYKDEVRQLGQALGMPEGIVNRQTFPGPGLAVRCLGEVTKEKLDILRAADAVVREEIVKAGLDQSIYMYFAILTGLRSTGVSQAGRTYGYTVAVRAIHSTDAMTANWVRLPYEVLEAISGRITAEVCGVNRVVYDITAKPPATIEWE